MVTLHVDNVFERRAIKTLNEFCARLTRQGFGADQIAKKIVATFPSHVQNGIEYQDRKLPPVLHRRIKRELMQPTDSDTTAANTAPEENSTVPQLHMGLKKTRKANGSQSTVKSRERDPLQDVGNIGRPGGLIHTALKTPPRLGRNANTPRRKKSSPYLKKATFNPLPPPPVQDPAAGDGHYVPKRDL